MPGVGVAPGLNGFFNSSGLGIPGVGVAPFGTLFASFGSGIPGVVLVDGGIGLADKPSGRLFASTDTFPTPADWFEFEFEFEPELAHAPASIAVNSAAISNETLNIK